MGNIKYLFILLVFYAISCENPTEFKRENVNDPDGVVPGGVIVQVTPSETIPDLRYGKTVYANYFEDPVTFRVKLNNFAIQNRDDVTVIIKSSPDGEILRKKLSEYSGDVIDIEFYLSYKFHTLFLFMEINGREFRSDYTRVENRVPQSIQLLEYEYIFDGLVLRWSKTTDSKFNKYMIRRFFTTGHHGIVVDDITDREDTTYVLRSNKMTMNGTYQIVNVQNGSAIHRNSNKLTADFGANRLFYFYYNSYSNIIGEYGGYVYYKFDESLRRRNIITSETKEIYSSVGNSSAMVYHTNGDGVFYLTKDDKNVRFKLSGSSIEITEFKLPDKEDTISRSKIDRYGNLYHYYRNGSSWYFRIYTPNNSFTFSIFDIAHYNYLNDIIYDEDSNQLHLIIGDYNKQELRSYKFVNGIPELDYVNEFLSLFNWFITYNNKAYLYSVTSGIYDLNTKQSLGTYSLPLANNYPVWMDDDYIYLVSSNKVVRMSWDGQTTQVFEMLSGMFLVRIFNSNNNWFAVLKNGEQRNNVTTTLIPLDEEYFFSTIWQ